MLEGGNGGGRRKCRRGEMIVDGGSWEKREQRRKVEVVGTGVDAGVVETELGISGGGGGTGSAAAIGSTTEE